MRRIPRVFVWILVLVVGLCSRAALAARDDHKSLDLPGRVGDWDFRREGEQAYVSSAPPNLKFKRPMVIAGRAEPPTGDLTLWYRQPANKWVEALPIGNGRLGAMVFGGSANHKVEEPYYQSVQFLTNRTRAGSAEDCRPLPSNTPLEQGLQS